VWICPQPFFEGDLEFPDEERAAKFELAVEGTANIYRKAKQFGVKLAFGSDLLFNPPSENQGAQLARLGTWFSPAEVLKIGTSQNADLLELSGPRHPYREGPLGVIAEGAYADLILVDGNPLENLDLIADPHGSFDLIMKDGVIYKNTLEDRQFPDQLQPRSETSRDPVTTAVLAQSHFGCVCHLPMLIARLDATADPSGGDSTRGTARFFRPGDLPAAKQP
jgi:hypothetical protein